MDVSVTYQEYLGSIIPDTFLSASHNIFLSFFGGSQSGTLTDASGLLTLGETVTIDGNDFTYRGHGSAQPGVDILGLIIPLGSAVDVLILEEQSTGDTFFVYPDGAPNLLGAIALTITTTEQAYDLTTNGPVCFVRGTLIETPNGPRSIETLAAGDVVSDVDGAPLRIIWAGQTTQKGCPPVVFDVDALGPGTPRRRLKLSAWHRLPLPVATEGAPLLAPAKAFTMLPKIRQSHTKKDVQYHHILTERHGLVLAEGLPAETLLLGSEALLELSPEAIANIQSKLVCTMATLPEHPAAQPCGRLVTLKEAQDILRALVDYESPSARKTIGLVA